MRKNIFFIFFIFLFFSCNTTSKTTQKIATKDLYPAKLTMIFAGDIMAHANNFRTGNFDKVWADISTLVKSADFSFANIEAPVCDELEWSSYPEFNMKSAYPEAAINAGFNVFSLVNNHSNDKGSKGIEATIKWSNFISENAKDTERKIYFSGLHKNDFKGFDYSLIEKGQWRILFIAMTEILNRQTETEYMNYVKVTENDRNNFTETVAKLKAETNANFCIVSVHCYEPEYVRIVPKKRKSFYYKLLDAGADVVWANHPHVILEHELVGDESEKEQNIKRKLIMYANGNTISGQRRAPNFSDPADFWEWTGDGVLTKATFEIKSPQDKPQLIDISPYYITSYINTANQIVIKKLDDNFIDYLINEATRPAWAKYIDARKKLVEQTKEITTWR